MINQITRQQQNFMGFPLAGGPDDDVSSLLSRDLFQQHMDKSRAAPNKNGGWVSNEASPLDSKESYFHVFEDVVDFNQPFNPDLTLNNHNNTVNMKIEKRHSPLVTKNTNRKDE